MKTSIIWTTAGIAAIGFGVPAYAAISSPGPLPAFNPPAIVTTDDSTSSTSPTETTITVGATPQSVPTISVEDRSDDSTVTSVEDISGNCDEAEHATDDRCTGVDGSDDTTVSTPDSVEDVSGNCDEAEHAGDPACGGTGTVTSVDDNPHTSTSVDDNGGGSGRGGNDDGGHGGSNDG